MCCLRCDVESSLRYLQTVRCNQQSLFVRMLCSTFGSSKLYLDFLIELSRAFHFAAEAKMMSLCQGSSRPSPKPGKITPCMRLHYPLHHTPVAPRASSKSYLSQPLRLRASFLPKHFDQQDLFAIAVSLEFLQRPNSDDDIPAPVPAAAPEPIPELVQEAAPAVQDTKPTPEPEPLAPEPSEPAPVPAQESQPNGAPIETKPEEPKTDNMSYADMAAKGPQQTDEQK